MLPSDQFEFKTQALFHCHLVRTVVLFFFSWRHTSNINITLTFQKIMGHNILTVYHRSNMGENSFILIFFQNLAKHLKGTHGTLLCPGTLVENHWSLVTWSYREEKIRSHSLLIHTHSCTQGGRGGRGAPHVPPIKIFENFHIKMQWKQPPPPPPPHWFSHNPKYIPQNNLQKNPRTPPPLDFQLLCIYHTRYNMS